jgi:hypothetical protein
MSRLRRALTKHGLVEAEPTTAPLPANVYLVLGLVGSLIGVGLLVGGQAGVGAVLLVLGLVNLALAALKRRRDAG